MAKQGIVTTAQDAITDAAKAGVSSVTSLAGEARKVATGAILRTVKRARAVVNSDLPKRKKARKKTARKAKKAVRKRAKRPVKKAARKSKRAAKKK